MKEYQAPQIEVVAFEVNDVVTGWFDSSNLGEWDKYSGYVEQGTDSFFKDEE